MTKLSHISILIILGIFTLFAISTSAFIIQKPGTTTSSKDHEEIKNKRNTESLKFTYEQWKKTQEDTRRGTRGTQQNGGRYNVETTNSY